MTESADSGGSTVRRPRSSLAVNRIRPAYEQVAEQLIELIATGSLAPGDRLPVEADLASAFGVSRGTMREALRILSARDLVYAVRGANGGTFVAEWDSASLSASLETGIGLLTGMEAITLDELLEARRLLEVPAARLAAERIEEAGLAELRQAVEEERGAGAGGVRYQQHRQFHAAVLAASGNRLLQLMTQPIFGVIRSRYVIQPTKSDLWHQIDEDHVEILQHISDGDAEGAAEAMHNHLVALNVVYRAIGDESAVAAGPGRPHP